MKQKALLVVFILIFSFSKAQTRMKITLNNGEVKEGNYKIKMTTMQMPTKLRIVSKKTKEKYTLDKVEKLYMFNEKDSALFEVIDTKLNLSSSKTKKKLGQVIFKGEHLNLYAVESLPAGGGTGYTVKSTYNEFFAMKKEQSIAFNIGYIDGAGPTGIKYRVSKFFSDCPSLIEKVESKEIPKKESVKIALYYEQQCK